MKKLLQFHLDDTWNENNSWSKVKIADPDRRIFVLVNLAQLTSNNWDFMIVDDFQVAFQNSA